MRKRLIGLSIVFAVTITSVFSGSGMATKNALAKKKNRKTASIVMVGDNLLHMRATKSGKKSNGTYNYNHIFKGIAKDVKAADVGIINQEVLLAAPTIPAAGYPLFNSRVEMIDAVKKAGFDVALHATNHSLDYGARGLKLTLRNWKKRAPKIKVTGMYASKKSADKITMITKNGIKIAILNYTYGTNKHEMPENMPFAVNMLEKEKVKRDVKLAKRNKADFIIVCPHWGTEFTTEISEKQKEWCSYFLKLGVNMVLGTHPHVIQPVEWLKDTKGHKMLVYYSLGNYMTTTLREGEDVWRQYCSGMAKIKIEKVGNKKAKVKTSQFVPLIVHKSSSSVTVCKVDNYTEARANNNYVNKVDPGFSYHKMRQLFRDVINSKFLVMK